MGNPVAGNRGFGTIVEQDAVLGSGETEGAVALGGDLTFGPGYHVGLHAAGGFTVPGDDRPTALLVGGRVDFAGSSRNGVLTVLGDRYLKIGDPTGAPVLDTDANHAQVTTQVVAADAGHNSVPRIELTVRQPPASVAPATGLIDFTALFATYRQRATALAACPENLTLTDAAGQPLPADVPAGSTGFLTLDPSRTNVLHLTGAALNRLAGLNVRTAPTQSGPLLVVVDTADR
ncbi:collagen-binding domain-containing protein, partial [Kitasatospora sp. NPDC002522]